MTLLATLLDYASSQRAHEEDPITEILAWLLDHDERVCAAFVRLLAPERVSIPAGPPRVRTQLTGPGGRYDIVLDWAHPKLRLIVEVKVNANLTYGELEGEDGAKADTDQITRYLSQTGDDTYVVALATHALELPAKTSAHARYLGLIRWQAVHDVLLHGLTDEVSPIDPEARGFARQFVHLMEARRMAGPKLTFDGMTAGYRFFAFRDAILPVLEQARDEVFQRSLAAS
jgi:hypothetical protein